MIKSLKTKIAAPVAALAAAVALTAIVPSAAQARPYDHYDRYERVDVSYRGGDFDFRGLQHRVNQGVRSGELNRREANRLNWQIDNLRDRADDYSRGGLSRWERRELSDRYAELSAQIYRQKHDYDYRGRNWR